MCKSGWLSLSRGGLSGTDSEGVMNQKKNEGDVRCIGGGGGGGGRNNNQKLKITYNIALGYWDRGYSW